MAGAAVGDDGHPVGIGQILTDDQVAVHIQNVRISQTQATSSSSVTVSGAFMNFFIFIQHSSSDI